MQSIIRQLAAEIKIGESQVRAAVDLLDGGATVPFIARYRKEATGGLDDIQLRELEARAKARSMPGIQVEIRFAHEVRSCAVGFEVFK